MQNYDKVFDLNIDYQIKSNINLEQNKESYS